MKKILIVALFVMVLVLAACQPTPAPTAAAPVNTAVVNTAVVNTPVNVVPTNTVPANTPVPAASTEDILIGNVQDLSGPNKAFGLGMTNAATTMVEKVNAAGGVNGRKIKLISYDTKGDVNESINAYRRLVEQDKVVSVLGPPIANIGIALAPVTEEMKVPMVGLFMDDRSTIQTNGSPWNYMFLAQNSSTIQAQIIAAFGMKELGLKEFAIIYNSQNAYSVSLAEPFKKYVLENGGKILIEETYTTADKDYRAQLTKIKSVNPPAIYAPAYPAEIPLVLTQAYELGITATILGDNSFVPFALGSSTDPAATKKVYFPYGIDPNDANLAVWTKAYTAKYNVAPVAQAYSGEDAFGIMVEAIKACGATVTSDCIAKQVINVKNYAGLQGKVVISPTRHQPEGLPMAIITVADGKPSLVKWYTTQGAVQ
jgi:branched-chain amino acid transport system substrate-binding protein